MKRLLILILLVTVSSFALFPVDRAGAAPPQNRPEQAENRARNRLLTKGFKPEKINAHNIEEDDLGTIHIRHRQTENGIAIFGAEIITHEKKDGKFEAETGEKFRGSIPTTTPALNSVMALAKAKYVFAADADADAELILYPVKERALLAYYINIRNTDNNSVNPRRETMIIDAITGVIIDRWDNLQTASTLGTGYGYYAGQVTNFPLDFTSGVYTMFDVANNGKTFDYRNRTCAGGCTSTGTIYSGSTNIFGTNGNLLNRTSIGVDAHFFAQKTLEYFFTTFGRKGIDNANNKNLRFRYMVSRTHYGSKYNNAFWDGASMTYGDGDGTTFRPFDSVDVVGHEMAHGITERTSGLVYRNESGAANESFSDIFGAVIENFVGQRTGFGGVNYPTDWWVGEDLYLANDPANPTIGIRNMADPHAKGHPDHYSEFVVTTADNGGVHTNSGIMNKVFYLLVQGGTNHADATNTMVTGLGLSDAAKVAYDADTKYCLSTDTYARIANAWMSAAKARFGAGSNAAQQAFNAWKACGVTPSVTP